MQIRQRYCVFPLHCDRLSSIKFLSKFAFIFFLFLICSTSANAECLEYEEIEGGPCNCWPTGWDGITGAEEICNISQYNNGYGCVYNVDDVSPSGGNFAGLHVFQSITEGIVRTWTGLTPGSEYTFVMWWHSVELDCSGVIYTCCADLWVVVDGEDFFYSAVDDWTLLELCIPAESDEITIEIKGILNSGDSGYILLDDASCDDAEVECCELLVDLQGDNEVCPNEDLPLFGDYMGDNGTVNIEWTSDPPDGINYLDDLSTTEPIFNFTTTDNNFEGGTYTFTMTVEDDLCIFGKEIEIEVLPFASVSFDFEENPLCSDIEEFELPIISNEGVSGTWNIDLFFPIDVPGQALSFFFTPDAGQVMCPTTTEHVIEIVEFVGPSFDFELEYCREAGGIIYLPEVSLEGIEGSWNEPIIEMDLFPDGIVDLIFVPDNLFCTDDVDWAIEIYSGEEPTFTLSNQLCQQSSILQFPTISNEGIEGTWTYEEIDPSQFTDFVTNTFTPNPTGGIDCYGSYEHVVEILDILSPQFDIPLNLCSTDDPIVLEPMSLEGYAGQWSTSILDPSTSPASTSIIWTPDPGQSPCVVQTEIIIQIEQAAIPTFTLPEQICNNQGNFIFPASSTNGIIGTWSIPNLDPSMLSGTVVSIFLPDGALCAEMIEAEIEVIDGIVPSFTIEENICASDNQISLPNVSSNGVGGTWDLPSINPNDYPGQSIEIIFTPNDPMLCAEETSLIINIEEETMPSFTFPTQVCWQDDDIIFQDTSINNIIGSWTSSSLDVENNAGSNFANTFTPNADFCASTIEANILVVAPYNIVYLSSNPTSCMEENGSIEADGEITDKLFSIDGGITWQTDPTFMNLAGGFYQLLISSVDLQDCILSYDISLTSPNAPAIDMINTVQLSSCNENDGVIVIEATGTDLEYSLDGGTSWQTDPTFENLSPNTYDVLIRAQNSVDCEISAFATIDDFPETTITNFVFTDITDCGLTDGSILIEASGLDLEYSIDNGMTWNNTGIFDNLSAGEYDIIVQSSLSPECNETRTQLLVAPGMPTIDNSSFLNPSVCSLNSGQISINATGNNLEYSIDGITWQESPSFDNLTEGTYTIIVRDADQMNCVDSREIILENEQDMLPQLEFNTIAPSACNEFDASIEVIGNLDELEFSIDGGDNWQEDPIFDFLPANVYTIIIRNINANDCTTTLTVTIQNPDCPCEDLVIDYSLNIPDCPEDINPNLGINFQLNSIDGSVDGDYQYEWSHGEETSNLSFLEDGIYTLTITYDEDCEWIETIQVITNPEITFQVDGTNPDCENIDNGSINFMNAQGGAGELLYSIDGINFQNESSFVELANGIYEVSVMDQLGCIQTDMIELSSPNAPQAALETNISILAGETILLDPQIELSDIDGFTWIPEEQVLDIDGTIASVSPETNTEFTFTYFLGECTFERSVLVEVIQVADIYIPNVFTPDGDGDNDFFYIQSQSNAPIESMRIYDRWGNVMYEKIKPAANNETDGWNGRFNNQLVNPGVYVYTVKYQINGNIEIESGTVTVID